MSKLILISVKITYSHFDLLLKLSLPMNKATIGHKIQEIAFSLLVNAILA